MLVSNLGRIQDEKSKSRYFPSVNCDGYCTVIVGSKKPVRVHRLVHMLFNDPELDDWFPTATVDHKDRDSANNRNANLRWATRSDQRVNQVRTIHGPRKRCSVDLPEEIWKVVRGVRVSNMGRIRFVRDDTKHYPRAIKAGYCRVAHGGKHYHVHELVLEAFGFPKPSEAHTVDHLNQNKSDNRLSNLRWATWAQQRLNQTDRLGKRERPVLGRVVGTVNWIEFDGCKDASKSTGASLIGVRQVANPNSGCTGTPGKHGLRFEFQWEPLEDLPNETWKAVESREWTEGRYAKV